jgi:cell division protein FtsL
VLYLPKTTKRKTNMSLLIIPAFLASAFAIVIAAHHKQKCCWAETERNNFYRAARDE